MTIYCDEARAASRFAKLLHVVAGKFIYTQNLKSLVLSVSGPWTWEFFLHGYAWEFFCCLGNPYAATTWAKLGAIWNHYQSENRRVAIKEILFAKDCRLFGLGHPQLNVCSG